MGPGDGATEHDIKNAYALGAEIAKNGWVLLSGGRNTGVMDAVSRGAQEAGGLVVGVLPSKDGKDASHALDIQIITGMGGARNVINVLSSDVVVACGMGKGTASEVAHAIKIGKPTILLNTGKKAEDFFKDLAPEIVYAASTVQSVINIINNVLS